MSRTLPHNLSPYAEEITTSKVEDDGKWLLFPSEEDWDKDTRVRWNPCPYNLSKYIGNEKYTAEIHLKSQNTMVVDGMLTGLTRPFRVYQDKDGNFTKYGDHPSLAQREKVIGTKPMSHAEWQNEVSGFTSSTSIHGLSTKTAILLGFILWICLSVLDHLF